MERDAVVRHIVHGGLIAVIRAESDEQALRIADACRAGGVTALEITFTVPGAARAIEQLAREHADGGIVIGAGTVLDAETARIAILSGAQFVLAPCLHLPTVTLCQRYDVPCIPGAMTVKEVVEAMEAGAPMVKVFPGEVVGPAFIKAVLGPLPHARLMPTGGVGLDNVTKWIAAGSAAVGVGGQLTAGASTGDYPAITDLSRRYLAAIATARQASSRSA